ncbi:hypothetical protein QR680_019184 [Steinernema hermaphroditum]|uniref:WD repeat-containing protein 55 homolog n=1 Tax=Steinernema hermaphroditum TaxID=289476 RepID=A0AA39HL83_9BILA|nr:hypothetical protein QR680_019184 [Steinernema hermaphroditum]
MECNRMDVQRLSSEDEDLLNTTVTTSSSRGAKSRRGGRRLGRHRRSTRGDVSDTDGKPFSRTDMIEQSYKHTIYGCAFNPYLPEDCPPVLAAVGGNRCTVYMLDAKAKKGRGCFYPLADLCAVTWVCDGDRYACVIGGSTGHMRCVDGGNGQIWQTFVGHTDGVLEIRTSPTETTIFASSSSDHSVRLWSTRFSQCLAIIGGVDGHVSEVISFDFDDDCDYLITGSMDHSVKLWNIGEGTEVPQLVADSLDPVKPRLPPVELHFPVAETRDVHGNYVDCVRLFGKFVISKAPENQIVIWKFGTLEDGIAGRGLKDSHVKETLVTHIAFLDMPHLDVWFNRFDIDVDRKYLVCASQRGMIRFWDLTKGLPKDNCDFEIFAWYGNGKKHIWQIVQVAFSHNGKALVAVGVEGRIVRLDLDD